MILRASSKRLVFALAALAAAVLPAADRAAGRDKQAEPLTFREQYRGPMRFTLGRLATTKPCGLDCVDFIVAEGEILATTSFQYLLATRALGERRPPILIDSPGGLRLGMGLTAEIWRKFGVTAVVARARETPCGGRRQKACDPADIAAKVKVFEVSGRHGECESACPFMILGAIRRIVPPGARIGLHAPELDTSEGLGKLLAEINPDIKASNRDSDVEDFGGFAEHYGASPEMAKRMVKTPHDRMDYLSPADVEAYRISTVRLGQAGLPPALARALAAPQAAERGRSGGRR